jgi:WD40 repeat protein
MVPKTDGQYIAAVGEDGFVHVWNFYGKYLLEFKAHEGAGNSIIFSPNSQYIATAGKDGFVLARPLHQQRRKSARLPQTLCSK